ncbi:Flp pilus assembly protein CpaB [Lacibacterium aquatile]|uniref:Flp pilus assembly protein CpaB n=1 Tax=Lacibacterium aquatile TaxID=1168082 RepID=A0ABW5DX32_9PROT
MRIGLFILAIVLAFSTALVATLTTRPPRNEIATEDILVLTGDVEAGEAIGANRLAWRPWPTSSITPGHIRKSGTATGLTDWSERIPLTRMVAGEPLLAGRVEARSGGALAVMIDKASRAVTIEINDAGGVGGFALPGDRVDVLFVQRDQRGQSGSGRVLVAAARVLAVNQAMSVKGATLGGSVKTATLEVTPSQASDLASAASSGDLSLSLRPLGAAKETPAPPPPPPLETPAAAPAPEPAIEGPAVTIYRGFAKESIRIER